LEVRRVGELSNHLLRELGVGHGRQGRVVKDSSAFPTACLSTGRYWVYIENTRPFPRTQLLFPGHGDSSNNFDGQSEVHPVNVPYQWNSGPLTPVVPYPVRFACRSSLAIYAHPPFYYTTRYSNPPALLDNKGQRKQVTKY